MKLCLLAFLFVLMQPSFAQTNSAKDTFKTYTSSTFGFSILCPQSWEINENINDIVPFIFECPRDNEADFFRENINAVVEISRGYLLSQYVDALIGKLQARLENFKLHGRGISTDNPLHPAWIIYDNAKGDLPFKFLSYFYKVGGNIYIITGTAKVDEFDRYFPTFERVCDSYRLLPISPELNKR